MKKNKIKQTSVDKYLASQTVEEILQDARLVLESKDSVCRRALAGTILVTLDQIELSRFLDELNKIQNDVSILNNKIVQYKTKVIDK